MICFQWRVKICFTNTNKIKFVHVLICLKQRYILSARCGQSGYQDETEHQTMFMKLRKIRDCLYGIYNFTLKNICSSTSTPETSENVFLLVFIWSFVSFGVCIRMQCEIKFQTEIYTRVNQEHLENLLLGKHLISVAGTLISFVR